MDGNELVRIIERELANRGISKAKFYEDCGISSAVFSNWRKNLNTPSEKNISVISQYLGLQIDKDNVFIPIQQDDETIALREMLRDRQDLRILLNSAKDVPVSSVYALIAQIEKMKEDNEPY